MSLTRTEGTLHKIMNSVGMLIDESPERNDVLIQIIEDETTFLTLTSKVAEICSVLGTSLINRSKILKILAEHES